MQKYYVTTLRLWELLKPFHKHFYIQLFGIVINQLSWIYIIVLVAKVLNSIVEKNFELATNTAILWFAIAIAKILLSYAIEYHKMRYVEFEVQQYLQEYSLKNIFSLNISQYIEDHSAIKLQVINRGEEAIENIVSTLVLNIVPTFTQVIFSLIAITWYSPLTALLCLISFLIAIIWTNRFSNFHRTLLKIDIDKWDIQKKIRTETFQHLNLVKTSGVEKEYLKKYIDRRFELIKSSVKLWTYSINHGNKRWAFFSLARFLATLELIREATQGRILVGGIYAVWSWLNDTFSNIQNVIHAMRRIPLRFVELEKYLALIDREPEFEERGLKKFEFGNIYFEHINFKYPKSENDVITDLNIEILKGQKTAFVGFSGSGKSTIIKLLLRIYDWNSGDIKIGSGENMKSLRNLDTQILRQKIGYVEQHVDLFDTTIRENILFGIQASSKNHKDNKNFNPELIDEVVHKSRIDQFFHRLGSDGLDTLIGERGVKLSGGERQRIGIARALVKNPEILVFDEATASLDTENEKYIQEAIDESSKGRTTIIIAHRLSTIQNADKIFVMDKGVVVGQGTHEFLKNTCEVYQRLIHAQNS